MKSPAKAMVVSISLSGGGAERFVSVLLERIDPARVRCELVTLQSAATYSIPDHVPVVNIEQTGPQTVWRTVRRLRRLIERSKPDVVLSTVDYVGQFVGQALVGLRSRPRWIAREGMNLRRRSRTFSEWVTRKWVRRVYRAADVIVANSTQLAASISEVLPYARGRVTSINNPVDLAVIHRLAREPAIAMRPATPLILFAGRLQPQKRPDLLLSAFCKVREQYDATLWVLGEGPLRASLEREVAKANLSNCVRFFGFIANPFPLIHQADVVALASDHEGSPNILLEAQALGRPVVSTRCPFGPDEIIVHGETGLLVPVGDSSALANALSSLCLDAAARRRMGSCAAEEIKNRFSAGPLVKQWEDLIESVARHGSAWASNLPKCNAELLTP